ncbi:MAG: glycosyltransferase [Campylobacterota bacterium]|nr:glycosyltransferase [Campylobacterota bacterium]
MNKKMITVFTNKDKKYIELLKMQDEYHIKEIQVPSFFDKIMMKDKQYADIYFHNGTLDSEADDKIKNAKKVIVNSFEQRHLIMAKGLTQTNNIDVMYPFVEQNPFKPKEAKQNIIQKYDLQKDASIILFMSNNFKQGGIKEFLHTLGCLSDKNFSALIVGNDKDISRLQFVINQSPLANQIRLIAKNKEGVDVDELFAAADIYLAPTYVENFSINILKAMIAKTAVFVSAMNASREIVDVFGTMSDPNDASTIFKVDALVAGHEIKKIKKENKKIAQQYLKEQQLKKLKKIIEQIST